MASPLVVPVSGYSTLSRFDSEISRSPTLTTAPPLMPRPYARRVGSGRLADAAGFGGRLALTDHLQIRTPRGMTASSCLGGFHAGLQGGHEIDDLRRCSRRCRRLEQLPCRLALDQIEDLLAIRVAV